MDKPPRLHTVLSIGWLALAAHLSARLAVDSTVALVLAIGGIVLLGSWILWARKRTSTSWAWLASPVCGAAGLLIFFVFPLVSMRVRFGSDQLESYVEQVATGRAPRPVRRGTFRIVRYERRGDDTYLFTSVGSKESYGLVHHEGDEKPTAKLRKDFTTYHRLHGPWWRFHASD
jgi:hypothetical protein